MKKLVLMFVAFHSHLVVTKQLRLTLLIQQQLILQL